jgi:hypothetical protein
MLVAVMLGLALLESRQSSHADDDGCAAGNNPFNRPDGTLIQGPGTSVYLIQNCQKRLIPHFEDYVAHSFINPVATVSTAEINKLGSLPVLRAREGKVLQVPGDDPVPSERNKVYLIDETAAGAFQKRYVTGQGWTAYFAPCGYTTTPASSAYLATYGNGSDVVYNTVKRPDGFLIMGTTTGMVYLVMDGQQRRYITNTESFTSYNFTTPVCALTESLINAHSRVYPDLRAREGTMMQVPGTAPVYIVERDPSLNYWKRWILSSDAFNYYGLSGSAIKPWSSGVVGGYTSTDHVHPIKSTNTLTWAKDLISQDLTMGRWYAGGASTGPWDSQIDGARDAWNSAPIAPDFVNDVYGSFNDVQILIENYGPTSWAGLQDYQLYPPGHPDQGEIDYARIYLNSNPIFSPSQHVVAHELGHAIDLLHDGVNPDGPDPDVPPLDDPDGACGGARVPQTVMDYDCSSLIGPANWDSCGINHKYGNGIVGC